VSPRADRSIRPRLRHEGQLPNRGVGCTQLAGKTPGSVNLSAPAAPPNNQFWPARTQFGGEPLANHIGGSVRVVTDEG
jgi:hypothetical protein